MTLTGTWTHLFHNLKCEILKMGNGSYGIYKMNAQKNNYDLIDNLDSVVSTASAASISVDDPTKWGASDMCDRIKIGSMIFSKPSGGSFGAVNNSNFNWRKTDQNISMVITDGG